MDLSPQTIATATFETVRKGYDPDDVRTYLGRVAAQLESAQQQAAAMEARARAAIAKMQELQQATTANAGATPDATPTGVTTATNDEAATISRTLLLAQRTADVTVADAQAQADAIRAAATSEATTAVDQARASATAMVEEARNEARRAKDDELAAAEGAVQSLLARRDFLLGDVEILEEHVGAQRERLREAATALTELVERVPAGLGEMRLPLLSASADDTLQTIKDHASTDAADANAHEPSIPAGGDEEEPAPGRARMRSFEATPAQGMSIGGDELR